MAARKKTEATEQKKITGTVTGGTLNIRDKANGNVIGTLPDGAHVEILKAGEEWHQIEDGYIMAKWVKLDA